MPEVSARRLFRPAARAAAAVAPLLAAASCADLTSQVGDSGGPTGDAAAAREPATRPATQPTRPISLTVYSSADPATFDPQELMRQDGGEYGGGQERPPGYGVVREVRRMLLAAGVNRVEVTDVAAGIDPTTVAFRSLTDPASAAVLEQNLEFDLASADRVLARYLNREVVLMVAGGANEADAELRCTLLALPRYSGPGAQYVVRTEGGGGGTVIVQDASRVRSIRLADSGRLIAKPTLTWAVEARRPGDHEVEIAYQTEGLTWRADYGLLLSADERSGDLSGWVSVVNASGLSYPDARLKLVAGKVNRLRPERERNRGGGGLFNNSGPDQFEEKAFFDYHLYTLARPTNLPDNSAKQVELFAARAGVPVEKAYMWAGPDPVGRYGRRPWTDDEFADADRGGVHVLLRLRNAKDHRLGLPLPAGRVRVYKADPADGSREFIGEDVIDHTPVDEPLLLKIGMAFDVVGDRTRTKLERDGDTLTESFEVSVRNRKREPVRVTVREHLYRWVNWKILEASDKYASASVKAIDFAVELPPGAEKKVSYTVRYSW